jgi:hypothetical protein
MNQSVIKGQVRHRPSEYGRQKKAHLSIFSDEHWACGRCDVRQPD